MSRPIDRRAFLIAAGAATVAGGAWWAWVAAQGPARSSKVLGREAEAPLAPAPPEIRGPGKPIPSAIAADGSRDVTVDLQDFLNGISPGSVVSFPQGARYRIEGTVTVEDRHDLLLEGNGAMLFASTVGAGTKQRIANRSHLLLRRGSRIVIRDLVIRGVNPKPGHFHARICCQHGIAIESTQGTWVEGCTIENVYGDNVYIDHDRPGGVPARGVVVSGNRFSGNGRQGIAAVNAERIWIQDNTLAGSGQTGIDLEPNTIHGSVTGVVISGNVFSDLHAVAIAAMGGGPVSEVWVMRNRNLDGAFGIQAGSRGVRQRAWRVIDNRGSLPKSPKVMRFQHMDDIVVMGNIQPLHPGPVRNSAVDAQDCAGLRILDNTFENATPPWGQVLSGTGNTDVQVAGNDT